MDARSPEQLQVRTETGGVKQKTFALFCKSFAEDIESPTFGEQRYGSIPISRKGSSASRELQKTGMADQLLKKAFLRRIYRLVMTYLRLEADRQKVRPYGKLRRPRIQKTWNAQRALKAVIGRLEGDFVSRYKELLDPQLVQLIGLAAEHIKDVCYRLQQREKTLVSMVPPAARRKRDVPSNWELLLRDIDYDLPKVTIKAPEQWLRGRIDKEIMDLVTSRRTKMSQMTRLKVISAILSASGIGFVQPTSIKEQFRSQKDSIRQI